MKLRNPLARRHSQEVVRQFGDALLIRNSNGQHELIGGTNADRTAAFEWVSLFAHEIVFTHFHRQELEPPCRSHRSMFLGRFEAAM